MYVQVRLTVGAKSAQSWCGKRGFCCEKDSVLPARVSSIERGKNETHCLCLISGRATSNATNRIPQQLRELDPSGNRSLTPRTASAFFNAPSLKQPVTDVSLSIHRHLSSAHNPSFAHLSISSRLASSNCLICPAPLPLVASAAHQIQACCSTFQPAAALPQIIRSHGFSNNLLRLQAPRQYVTLPITSFQNLTTNAP
jgi:hypothetical protein